MILESHAENQLNIFIFTCDGWQLPYLYIHLQEQPWYHLIGVDDAKVAHRRRYAKLWLEQVRGGSAAAYTTGSALLLSLKTNGPGGRAEPASGASLKPISSSDHPTDSWPWCAAGCRPSFRSRGLATLESRVRQDYKANNSSCFWQTIVVVHKISLIPNLVKK